MDSARTTSDEAPAQITPARRSAQHTNPELLRLLRADELLAEAQQLDEVTTPAPLYHPGIGRELEGADALPGEQHP
jgi:hypothetical protein